MVDNKTINLALWDSNCTQEYDLLRPASYAQTGAFLLAYSVVNQASFEHIKTKWAPEVAYHMPNTTIVLVATKLDLRDDPNTKERLAEKNMRPVTREEGEQLCQEIGAARFIECSAMTQQHVKDVFDETMRAYLKSQISGPTPNVNSKCVLL